MFASLVNRVTAVFRPMRCPECGTRSARHTATCAGTDSSNRPVISTFAAGDPAGVPGQAGTRPMISGWPSRVLQQGGILPWPPSRERITKTVSREAELAGGHGLGREGS